MFQSRFVVMVSLLSALCCSSAGASSVKDTVYQWFTSGRAVAMTPSEIQMQATLQSMVDQIAVSRNVKLQVVNSDKALEFQVLYHAGDKDALIGLAGQTQRSVQMVMNEISISTQRNEAERNGTPFDITKRKLLFVRYYELDE